MSFEQQADENRWWDPRDWSLRVGSLFGIRIRLHWLLLLFAVYLLSLQYAHANWWIVLNFGLPAMAITFLTILLHEFGHCFGCRAVGGQADDVLLWPLGGLAQCDPPHRPYEFLVTIVCGPLVNVLIALLLLPILVATDTANATLFNPMTMHLGLAPDTRMPLLWTAWAFKISLWLFFFNLLPIFPLDGGQTLLGILWVRKGYYAAAMIATTVGVIGAVLLIALALWLHEGLAIAIGLFALIESIRFRQQLETMGDMDRGEFGYDFSQGFTSFDRSFPEERTSSVRVSLRQRLQNWFRRRRERQTSQEEAELDRILDKIHANGMDSLTWSERRILESASRRRRH